MVLGTKKRINWIDIAKGIAIMLVILGHTVKRGDPIDGYGNDVSPGDSAGSK